MRRGVEVTLSDSRGQIRREGRDVKLARNNLAVGICAAVFDPREGDEAPAEIRPRHFDLQVDFVRPQRHEI